jgi:hypothetical protein
MEKLDDLKSLDCIGKIEIVLDQENINFVKGLTSEIKRAREQKKRIEYFSEKVIIFSSKYDANLGEDLHVLEVVYRKTKNTEYYYIPNKGIHASYLLYLINKGENE